MAFPGLIPFPVGAGLWRSSRVEQTVWERPVSVCTSHPPCGRQSSAFSEILAVNEAKQGGI